MIVGAPTPASGSDAGFAVAVVDGLAVAVPLGLAVEVADGDGDVPPIVPPFGDAEGLADALADARGLPLADAVAVADGRALPVVSSLVAASVKTKGSHAKDVVVAIPSSCACKTLSLTKAMAEKIDNIPIETKDPTNSGLANFISIDLR